MCVSLCVGRGGPLPPAWGRGLQGDVDVGGARARALPPVRKMARRGQARAAVQDVSSPSAQSALGFGTRLSVNFRLHLPPPRPNHSNHDRNTVSLRDRRRSRHRVGSGPCVTSGSPKGVSWLTGQPPGVSQLRSPSFAEFKCCGKSRPLWSDPDS